MSHLCLNVEEDRSSYRKDRWKLNLMARRYERGDNRTSGRAGERRIHHTPLHNILLFCCAQRLWGDSRLPALTDEQFRWRIYDTYFECHAIETPTVGESPVGANDIMRKTAISLPCVKEEFCE